MTVRSSLVDSDNCQSLVRHRDHLWWGHSCEVYCVCAVLGRILLSNIRRGKRR